MNKSQALSAQIEPNDFDAPEPLHFPDCRSVNSEDALCDCDQIERDCRDAFAAMTRENYK